MSSLLRFSSACALLYVFVACAPSAEGDSGPQGTANAGPGTGLGGNGGGVGGGSGNGGGSTGLGGLGIIDWEASDTCGDGTLDANEQCDDANKESGDGCTAACQLEVDFICPTAGQPCESTAICGNGSLSSTEACDDGNNINGDGCSADCLAVDPGWQCRKAGSPCIPLCGDGVITPPENCDDANVVSGDGCSSTCLEEPGWSCEVIDGVYQCKQAQCGNGGIPETGEACDAGAANGLFYGDGSGCSKTCTSEPSCRDAQGNTQRCVEVCGNANIDPNEQCDDGNLLDGDGCSSTCTVEEGFSCETVQQDDTSTCGGQPCLMLPIIFRDFNGAHMADGHNDFFFMGANGVRCVPNASGVLATRSNGTCWTSDATDLCSGLVASSLGPNGKPVVNPTSDLSCSCRYTDWDNTGILGSATGTDTCNDAGGNQRTYLSTSTRVIESADSFAQWYTDSTKSAKVAGVLELVRQGNSNLYQFSSSGGDTVYDDIHEIFMTGSGTLDSGFFPLDDSLETGSDKLCNLWPYWLLDSGDSCVANDSNPVTQQWDPLGSYTEGQAGDGGPVKPVRGMERNFYFTSEVRYLFRYEGGETLSFFGDDDVWVFINGKLVLDLGAPHERLQGNVTLTPTGASYEISALDISTNRAIDVDSGTVADLGLEPGGTYEIAVFHADRHPRESNYQLTLTGFSTTKSQCIPLCGDGVVATGEECDDGAEANTGAYGGCTPDCKYASFCGDGVPDEGFEACDLGRNNVGVYGDLSSCAPGCVLPHYCGDGFIDSAYDEECDDRGESTNCTAGCKLKIL